MFKTFIEYVGTNRRSSAPFDVNGRVRVYQRGGYVYVYDVGCKDDSELMELDRSTQRDLTSIIINLFHTDPMRVKRGTWNGSFYIKTLPNGDPVIECGRCDEHSYLELTCDDYSVFREEMFEIFQNERSFGAVMQAAENINGKYISDYIEGRKDAAIDAMRDILRNTAS